MSFDTREIILLVESLRTENQKERRELREDINKLYELHSNTLKVLTEVKEQTIRTNGRVNKLEDDSARLNQCVCKVETETEVVRFFSKYPALLKIIIGFILLGSSNSIYAFIKTIIK